MGAIKGLVDFLVRMADLESAENLEQLSDYFLDLHRLYRDKYKERKAKPLASIYLLKPDPFEEPKE